MTALDCMYSTMSASQYSCGPDYVAEKVLRRVEIAKVARNLQDCLAFASFKAQNGWQDRTLRTIEPEVTEQLKRKRPHSSDDIMSDSSSTTGELHHSAAYNSASSFTGPASQHHQGSFKAPQHPGKRIRSSSSAGHEARSSNGLSWKLNHQLSQSSPVCARPHTSIGQSHTSMRSEATIVPNSQPESSPLFDMSHTTEEDDTDHPMHSFQHPPSSSIVSSSPPRTPPQIRRIVNSNKHDGADLLLYLANSPSRSPGGAGPHIIHSSQEAPSTPPSRHSHLPSSVVNTPGVGLLTGAFHTPGQSFNFADFVNMTPEIRTPGMPKTPSAARLTRRGLNFDALVPPTGSPDLQRRTRKSQGLALELGEELMPRS